MRHHILSANFLMFLFAIVLLTYGVQGISYAQKAVTGNLTECSGVRRDWPFEDWVDVTIKGTVRATRNVTNLRVEGTANGDFVGMDFLGELSAGSSKNFSITGVITTNENTLSCGASLDWIEFNQPEPPAQKPDLVVARPTVNKSALAPGERFTLSTSVRNAGEGRADSTTLWYYRSSDSRITTSDTEVGTDSVSTLSANRSSDESITLTAPTSAGTYYYGACVDSVTDESNSNNNCSTAVSITVEVLRSDLVVARPTVNKSTLAPGERFTLSTSVKNAGDGRADSTTLRYYRSTYATITTSDTEVGTDSVSALSANRSSDESITLTAPSSPGTYYYGACVDSVSDESNSNNNCSDAVSITVEVLRSDLVVARPTVNKSTLAPGERFTLSTSVKNAGDGRADSTTLRYYRSTYATITTGDTEVGTDSVSTLSANRSSDESITLTAPTSAGTYYYGACVDSVTDESNSNNNCSTAVSITVEVLRSDLVLARPTVSQSTLTPGERFTLSATVANNGAGSAAATTLRYYRSTDATITTSDTEVGTDSVSTLGANRSSDESITLTAPTSAGTYYYGVCVDSVTDESNSNNNCSDAVSITVNQPTLSTSTTSPLTEANLDTSIVTLTLSGGTFHPPVNGIIGGQIVSNSVLGVEVSGIPGVTIPSERVPANVIINGVRQSGIRYAIDRISGTQLEVELAFDGTNFDTDATLTFTVEAEAIAGYNGPELTAQVSVTAIKGFDFDLSVPAGMSMIHVPLNVTKVDGRAKTIESISDLYDALGGAAVVIFLITYDSATGDWLSYFGASDKDTATDRTLTDDMGIMANLVTPTTVRLTGDALGTDSTSTVTLTPGLNLVGLPLRDSTITRVSDLLALDGIRDNVPVIIFSDNGEFKAVGRAGDPGDIEITGGQSFILTAQRAATVGISGEAWTNVSGTAAAPPVTRRGIEVGEATPVLALTGSIVDEGPGVNTEGLRVTVKNLTTDRAVASVTARAEADYRLTVIDIEMGRAATLGDVLEISVQSPNRLIGAEPLRHIVTVEDVKRSRIHLPELVVYEIPSETQLLRNYPNPFNPETWIPYHLATDTDVSLFIYDMDGVLVRELDLGHQRAGYYTDRSRAAYWDGRNGLGEGVASGVYFYQLRADSLVPLRKMVILK